MTLDTQMQRLYILWLKLVLSVYFLLDEFYRFGAGAVVVVIRRAAALGAFGTRRGGGNESDGQAQGGGGGGGLWPLYEGGGIKRWGKEKWV